jgi:hypothetical protein
MINYYSSVSISFSPLGVVGMLGEEGGWWGRGGRGGMEDDSNIIVHLI